MGLTRKHFMYFDNTSFKFLMKSSLASFVFKMSTLLAYIALNNNSYIGGNHFFLGCHHLPILPF